MAKKSKKTEALNPHDNFFRVAFSNIEVVEGYLAEFLPKSLVEKIDLASLEQDNSVYVTPNLKPFYSDVVWQCNFGGKTPIKIAFLFEHKSYVPQYPHLQLLRYLLEVWQNCTDNQQPLIPVIPIIVYHNKENKKWNKKSFSDYFQDIDKELLPFIPTFDYQLTDLTDYSEEQILSFQMSMLVKAMLTLRFGTDLEWILSHVQTLFVGYEEDTQTEHLRNFFLAQFVYVQRNNEFDENDVNHFIKQLPKSSGMTGYDLILKKGEEKGIEKGIEIGASKEKQHFTISLLISTDFNDEKITTLVGVEKAYVEILRTALQNKND